MSTPLTAFRPELRDRLLDPPRPLRGAVADVEALAGHAVVLEVFRSSRFGTIAGVKVETGFIKRNCKVRLIRDGKPIYTAPLASLRRFKEDVNEVKAGTECGIGVKNYNDVKSGDQIEVFERFEVAPEDLGPEWQGGFYCPCHGSKFDLAGRVFEAVPAPLNLLVPPHRYIDDSVILIGSDSGVA